MRWLVLLMLSFTSCGLIAWPGRPCSTHDDCAGLKDGYCSKAEICTRECSDAKPCPEGSTCTTAGGSRSVCLHACATNEDCGTTSFVCSQNVCVVAKPMEPPPK
jgi:hypothetical protein